MTELRLFVACAPGLEPLLVEELRALELEVERSLPGGVELVGDHDVLARVLLGCGLGMRVLVRIASFAAREFHGLERGLERVREFHGLERGLERVDWSRWIEPGAKLEVRATARRARLHHTGALAERVELAIARALELGEGEGQGEPTLVHLRNDRDRIELSIDACGAALHKRGWRLEPGKAPLREDIARALLHLVGFAPGTALIDPVAGSGTLVIEAATIAAGLLPGASRRFACMNWPDFDVACFARAQARFPSSNEHEHAPLLGRDRNEGAVTIALANAGRAGVGSLVQFEARSLGDRSLPPALRRHAGPLALVGNPPWGQRVGDIGRLRNLYASFGNLARSIAQHRPLAIGLVTPDRMLAGATGLGLEARVWTDQGGTRIGLFTARIG